MKKDLRYQILKLLRDYTLLGYGVPFDLIAKRFPTKSYKSISVQLSCLKEKGFVTIQGSVGRYLYFITPKGIQNLTWTEAKKQREIAVLKADVELRLAEELAKVALEGD